MPHKDPEVRRAYMKAYTVRYYQKNSKALNAKTMAWRKKSPENWAKKLEAAARYRKAHPDRVKSTLAVVDKRPHRVLYRMQWKKTHPEIMKVINTKARIKRSLAIAVNGGTCTLAQWYARCAFYGWRCAYCEKPLVKRSIEIDHVIPIANGGTGWPANLVPACRSCNARKGRSTILPRRLLVYVQRSSGAVSESG